MTLCLCRNTLSGYGFTNVLSNDTVKVDKIYRIVIFSALMYTCDVSLCKIYISIRHRNADLMTWHDTSILGYSLRLHEKSEWVAPSKAEGIA